jgi:hypothetical protein
MTGISNFGLLFGKSMPRLALVVLFLLVTMPFLVLSVTMGGVIMKQVGVTILGLACYTLYLNQVGLFASTVGRNTRAAFAIASFLCVGTEIGFLAFWLLGAALESAGAQALSDSAMSVYSWLQERSMWMTLDDYMVADPLDPIWQPQMTFHLCMAAVLFVVSLLSFDRFNDRVLSQDASPGVGGRVAWRRRLTIHGRVWSSALVWKSWVHICGGAFWFLVKLVGLPMFAMLLVLIICIAADTGAEIEMFGVAMIMLGMIFFVAELGRSLGRVLNDEINQKTLTSLCLLPRRMTGLVVPLISGALPALVPGLVTFGLGWCVILANNWMRMDFFEPFVEPWFWHCWTWVLMAAFLTLALSCRMRYGAFLGALATMALLSMVTGTLVGLTAVLFNGFGPFDELLGRYLLPMGLMLLECCACALLFRSTIRRLEDLAGK